MAAVANDHLIPSEDEEQMLIFAWRDVAMNTMPDLEYLFAVPNGGKRSITTAKRMKATGTMAGVPDMCLPVAKGGYFGLWIELKRVKGGKVSVEQARWLKALDRAGYYACVCHGADEAINVIRKYLRMPDTVSKRSE